MNSKSIITAAVLSVVAITTPVVLMTCFTRIETGTVGVRVGFTKEISPTELLPGSFNQHIVGDILTFPVKDVSVLVDNMTPVAKDNSTMKDFDATIVYSINPDSVSELYSTKNKSFHATSGKDTLLMYHYIVQSARNAFYKAARTYDALEMADNRDKMELTVKDMVQANLHSEKLSNAIVINQVLIRMVVPADAVVASSNELVRAKNTLRQKEIEVQTAEAEARRMSALTAQSAASINYMNAQAQLTIAEAVKLGKVQTIVIPYDFKGIIGTSPAAAK